MVLESKNTSRIDFATGPAKWLRLMLAVLGCGLMVAAFAVFLPVKVMATVHGWLGLGEFPNSPITIYLARSTSLLYAVHGLLMLVVSFDMKRYWPLVPVFCWLHVVIGLTMFVIDFSAPMPNYWIACEGLPIAATGLLMVWLWRSANPALGQSESG